jgi:hypothetical protein
MEKEFNPNIDYSIKINGSENVIKLKISLFDIEDKGLNECIREKMNGEIFIQTFDIVFRKIHLTHIKDFDRENWNRKFKPEFKKREYNDKKYRVYLNTIKGLPELAPRYVDITAENERRAIIRALHSIKVFDFPNGWDNADVSML